MSSKPPVPLIPVSAEDFARRKRRIVGSIIGVVVVAALLGGWIYRRSADRLQAPQVLEQGRRELKAARYTQAILTFDHALALRGDLAEAYLMRGQAWMSLGETDRAIEDFGAMIRLRPQNAEAFLERARAHLGKKNYPAVAADAGDALTRDPGLAPAYTLRGVALRESGDPRKALADFNRAVELAPSAEAYFERATDYQLLGEHKLAIADLDQVIEWTPGGPSGFFARARSRLALGDVAGAEQDHQRGLERELH